MPNKKAPKNTKKRAVAVVTEVKTRTKTKVRIKPQSTQVEMHEPEEVPKDSAHESKKTDFYVACIGASAGGLTAITEFISDFPIDSGVALVFIQHLPDESKTILTDLLEKRTVLPVHEAQDDMAIEPNNLYVIPSARNMTIDKNGKLKLMKRSTAPLRYSIDELFNAIALVAGEKAIGVVLSGTASDGTLGLKAIQAAGGITFAQNEASSEYVDMPHHAMATGAADYVLHPKEIAKKIVEISQFDKVRATEIEKNDIAKSTFRESGYHKILLLVQQASDVDFTFYRQGTLRRRIERRMILNKIRNLELYADFLEHNLNETDQLYQELLIHVTEFFRNPESFEALKLHVFPKIFARKSKDVAVRMWVPGCSTGEEVYSLAICLLEYMDETKQYCPVQIFGTDLSEEILIKARRGKYPEDIKAYVSPERLERFFTYDKQGGTYTISRSIRSFCVFAKHNFVRDTPFSNLDLVSCRNVLIYLDSVLQQRVFPVFHFSLNPRGFLFLGSSESATKFEEFFGVVDRDHKIYRRKLATGIKPLNFHYSQGNITEVKANIAERLRASKMPEIDISKKVDEIILTKYAPPTVVLNEDYSILQYRGNMEKFLSHPTGNATHHIVKTARKEILPALLDALLNAKSKKRAVRKDNIIINFHKDKFFVTIDVTPVTLSNGVGYVVIFTDVPRYAVKERISSNSESKNDFEVRMLQEELLSTSENLHAVIETQEVANEELRVSNEETMSANEELQSINEELETMKEELESSNEELITLNEEVGARNEELSRLDEAKRELVKTVEGKDQFISILAHELRNPLTPILHSIEVLKLERGADKELLRTLAVIERQSNNISLILKSLLDTSRAMQGKITLQKTLLDPKTLIQNAIETITPLLLASGHTIEIAWLDEGPRIEGDALRLEQVFVNLLSNAIKYTPNHGKIWVSLTKANEYLEISIKDNGMGIALESQSKIFNLFMQGDQESARIKGGLGVGLMLSRLLVELHKGTLIAKSAGEGRGSEFIVHLPILGDNEVHHLPLREHQYEVTRHKGKRVLVVDDHILLADTFSQLLTALKQEVKVAYDAKTAVQVATDFIPEVVFMDLSMPVVDGFQLIKMLKKIPTLKETYFIALSGLADKPTINKALQSGFDKHLMKPAGAEEIMMAIEGAEK